MNRGLVSRLGLARADIKRLALATEVQKNWVPRVLGSMMLRPGWAHLGSSLTEQRAFHIPFVFSITDKAIIELTNAAMRVWVNDALVTRAAVTTAITNGSFTVNLTGWTDADEAGAVSAWVAGGYLGLTGTGTAYAIRRQQVICPAPDQNVEHALRIVIVVGPALLRVGSTSGNDDLIPETELGTGEHSLTFTPTAASFWVEFKSRLERVILVDQCTIEAAGVMSVAAPWLLADLRLVRHDQSGDVIFVACGKTTDKIGYQQRKIERRTTRSWSVVLYEPEDGPFRIPNVSPTTLTASALSGNITVTASTPIFRSGHVGALFQHISIGQAVEETIIAQNVFSDPIRITGVTTSTIVTIRVQGPIQFRGDTGVRDVSSSVAGGTRIFTILVTGLTGTGSTVTLQRSLTSATGPWEDVVGQSYVADTTKTFDDGLNNQIVFYRIGVKLGDYAAGIIVASLDIASGSITGVFRVTTVTSALLVNAEVITTLGGTDATDEWSEGSWSAYRGYPTAVTLYEGRLNWDGRDEIVLSISDGFESFDPAFEGDAGPIQRSIGSGPVDTINWALPLQRLILGGQGAEYSARSSSLDEPLTPTNFNLKAASTQGSAPVAAVKIDQSGAMVQRGGIRVFELAFGQDGVDYQASQLSALIPEIGRPGIVKMVVQRQPDTRLHCLRSDGTVAMLVFDKLEQVIAWGEIESAGEVEDAVVLPGDPGDEEDHVYYSVKRTIEGVDKRFLEKWAFEAECQGDAALCNLGDSFVTYSGAPATAISVPHLESKAVVVWADGADVGTDTAIGLLMPGAAGDYANTPDRDANSITGDIDIRVEARLDNWNPLANQVLVAKSSGAGNNSYIFRVQTTGVLAFFTSNDGTTTPVQAQSTVALGLAAGIAKWVRVTLDVDNEVAGNDAKFYTSDDYDPDTLEGTWTQLGATVTSVGATSIFNGTADLEVGTRIGGTTDPLTGKVYRAQIFNGIDGTLVADFDPTLAEEGDTAFTAATGEVWTTQGNAALTFQTYQVQAGVITLETAASNVVVGLPYEAPWKSSKFVELMGQPGGSLSDTQMIKGLALILADIHAKGLKYGQTLVESEMDDMPEMEESAPVDPDAVRTDYAQPPLLCPGGWSNDARLCLLAKAPRPATVLAALAEIEHHG